MKRETSRKTVLFVPLDRMRLIHVNPGDCYGNIFTILEIRPRNANNSYHVQNFAEGMKKWELKQGAHLSCIRDVDSFDKL